MGTYADCWLGDLCMPEGSICPPSCSTPAPSECLDGEVMCDMGTSADGCWLGDYCMAEGSVCPSVCFNPPPSECAATDIRSEMRKPGLDLHFFKINFCIKLWHGNTRRLLAGRLLYARGLHLSSRLQHSGPLSVPGRRHHVRLRGWRQWMLDGRLLHASGFRVSTSCRILIWQILISKFNCTLYFNWK